MPDFDDVYGYDEQEAKGKWFTIDGIKVKLAFADSPEIESKVHERRFELSKEKGSLTEIEMEQIGIDVFCEFVLLDWQEGMKVKGVDFPCNIQNKKELTKLYPKFINNCIYIAKDNKQFREKRVEETVKK